MDDFSQEDFEQAKHMEIRRGLEIVGPMIDDMTSSQLKRVLKTITFVHTAEAAQFGTEPPELSEQEQKLVDTIFALQEAVLATMMDLNIEGDTNE